MNRRLWVSQCPIRIGRAACALLISATLIACDDGDGAPGTNDLDVPLSILGEPAGALAWTPRQSDQVWQSVASSGDGNKLVAVAYGGKIHTSTDSGVTWAARGSDRFWQSVASSADGSKLVAVEYGGQIYASTDSGATWASLESPRYWWSVTSSADGSNLVAAVRNGPIYTAPASTSLARAARSAAPHPTPSN